MASMKKNEYVSPKVSIVHGFREDVLTLSPASTAGFGIELDWENDGI